MFIQEKTVGDTLFEKKVIQKCIPNNNKLTRAICNAKGTLRNNSVIQLKSISSLKYPFLFR